MARKKSDKAAKKPDKAPAKRSRLRRIVRWMVVIALVACLVPMLLTLVYRIESVHPVSTLMITNKLAGKPVARQWVEIEDVSNTLKHAVIMSEDGQFCRHHGVDLGELRGVVEAALDGEATRGASTITMQTAKNLFLWNSRSYVRKVLEIPLALWIDLVLPKRRIMEIYLNIAEWGPGIYGVDQAAGFHFGKHPDALTRRQGALLAVTLPNPALRDPAKPGPGLTRLSRIIERRARNAGGYVECLNG